MTAQAIRPDIFDSYLVGVGAGSWTTWNSPSGAYVSLVIASNKTLGAVSMFTLYQMAQNGDGNLTGLSNATFMTNYWSQVKLMFQLIGASNEPALVNLEPDFWGYVHAQAPSGNPALLPALVSQQPECADLANTTVGVAACLLRLGRQYAPLAKLGFPPSFFGQTATSIGNFMKLVGADQGDFIVAQTSDRDAGCFELASPPPECAGRGAGPFYWTENGATGPSYSRSLTDWATVRDLLGGLPILFWQTPMGVPSATPGGTTNRFRDNHVDYMLTHPTAYTAIGVFGLVFSAGAGSQTTIATDGGQFARLLTQYLAAPAAFP